MSKLMIAKYGHIERYTIKKDSLWLDRGDARISYTERQVLTMFLEKLKNAYVSELDKNYHPDWFWFFKKEYDREVVYYIAKDRFFALEMIPELEEECKGTQTQYKISQTLKYYLRR